MHLTLKSPVMNVETLRQYCLSKKLVTESLPFGDDTLVFKVIDKIFALINLDGELSINLKCDPEKAIELREKFNSVLPGYHMNKVHWNTVMIDGTVPDKLIEEWIDHSYEEVVKSLPKSKRGLIGKAY
jgi:predicted DNA-binding protein (MmcQ/YjbR family)